MSTKRLNIVIIGLTITSSWGNGHATTFRSLVKELDKRGHKVTFLEHDKPWYSSQRDLPNPPYCQTHLYASVEELKQGYEDLVKKADMVIVGSYVPQGIEVGSWVNKTAEGVRAFYDIDTPVTIAQVQKGACDYLNKELIPQYNLYLSFSGGTVLDYLEREMGAQQALPLYCSVDPELYYPEAETLREYDLGYMGTYSDDRQPPLDKLMLEAARLWPEGKFIVAGPQYPATIQWPANVARLEHLPPAKHRHFYNQQRFTQNITRADMIRMGYSPSVRLFEAAACGTPIISDFWEGLDSFFSFGDEILVSYSAADTLKFIREMPEEERVEIGRRARTKVLNLHTAAKRAEELESYALEMLKPA
ncbi:glycosyltransferase [Cesiribacter sp. SM1]|uniref:CgeB family protein n=1 Tax=Cesiribacter sp. SM1 TaxID=2861196 RepID=UPI001CD3EE93|nr:glycosyltransferase [Cesiribacter sp. SM1]